MIIEKAVCRNNDEIFKEHMKKHREKIREDFVALTHEEMNKPHQRVTTEKGEELKISLNQGERLSDGMVLVLNEVQAVSVKAAPELVLVIKPENDSQWGKAGYNIGNMHSAAYLTDTEILVPFDPSLERIVKLLEVPYFKEERGIVGERAAVKALAKGAHSHEQPGAAHSHEQPGAAHSHEQPGAAHSHEQPGAAHPHSQQEAD